ncbi:stage II sporulation protein M [Sporosalibacterium faouarense]|uniref:stage II sporulation protein M n=1 Tax=Sporosalibacterium faouarense TaxID=516123 RepID=UPI00192B276F|nr:stage II sporulation protein M [Sporosalibacterium faouarense]
MLIKLSELFNRHFRENFFIYFVSILSLMIGVSVGAITIKILNTNQKHELISFLDSFFKVLNESSISSLDLLKQSLFNNLQTVLLIWILGIIVIGIPVIIGVLIMRGFVIGFTVGFLIEGFGFKGFLFAIFAVLPQNIFIIPSILIISVIAFKFSIVIIKNKIKKAPRYNFMNRVSKYSISILMISSLMVIGSIVEAYITPIFMRLISSYIS